VGVFVHVCMVFLLPLVLA